MEHDHDHVTGAAHEALRPTDDLAGLPVHDSSDLRVGHVFGLLSDVHTGLVRFLDIAMDGEARHVLVPIGHAKLVQPFGEPRLRLRAASVDDLIHIPTYEAEQDAFELAYRSALLAAHGRLFRGDRYYAHPAYDHRGLYAGAHPIVRTAERNSEPVELLGLNETGEFQIAEGEPDVRTWSLRTASGVAGGDIEDLLIDPIAERVRYLVILLRDESRVLLPIGYLDLDLAGRTVSVRGLEAADLEALPRFSGLPLPRGEEAAHLETLERLLDARNPFLRADFSDRELLAQEGTAEPGR